MMVEQEPKRGSRASRFPHTRRSLLQAGAGGAGGLFILGALAPLRRREAMARSDEDDRDDSGSGESGRDDRGSDDSGHDGGGHDDSGGGAESDEEAVVVTGQVPAGSLEVRIVSDDAGGFVPGALTVDAGQSVTFINAHDDAHTATGSGFDTGIIQPGGTATVILEEPGTFAYACQIHPVMTGSIGVRGADGTVPPPAQSAPVPEDAATVRIANFAFDPPAITVAAGTTVAWTNDDSVPHTVTALDGAFDSGIFDPGGTFAWEFTTPGTFSYQCNLHPQMQGSVEVTGEGGVSAQTASATPEATGQSPQTAATSETAVSIVDFAFEPAVLDVPAGATVVWTNTGQVPHTVTGSFADSGALSPGQMFRHTFAEAGAFDYVCSFHPQMTGRVQVGADAAPAASPADPPTSDTNAAGIAPVGSGPVGTWLMTLTPEEDFALPPQQALVHLHADGTLDAAYAPIEPASGAAGVFVRDGQGTWQATDAGYTLSAVALLTDENERYAGLLRMQEKGEVDAAGESVRGRATFAVTGPDGGDAATGSGTTQGTRIRLDDTLG